MNENNGYGEFELCLTKKEIPFTSSTGERFIIVEASEAVQKQFQAMAMKSAKYGADGRPTSMNEQAADLPSFLVSKCVYQVKEVTEDGNKLEKRTLVQLPVILQWPARAVKKIFDTIQEISDMKSTPETAEQIEKEIEKLQKKLEKVRKHGPLDDAEPNDTTESSELVES